MSKEKKTRKGNSVRFSDIGERLRAFRLGRGITPEDLARRLGISRAAMYRAEKGHIPKIEALMRIGDVLGVPLPSLLGVGVEYVDEAVAFFERMRQLEEHCQHIIMLFGPVSFLLTSDEYDEVLREALVESVPDVASETGKGLEAINTLMRILAERKAFYTKNRPSIVSLISSSDLERFLLHGLTGRHDLSRPVIERRRHAARREVEHILQMLVEEPIGVQIGIVREPTPATSFQIFRQKDRSILAISPFRLGEQPNTRVGVALITSAPDAVTLHESIVQRLWDAALKGPAAARYLTQLIDRYGIDQPRRARQA